MTQPTDAFAAALLLAIVLLTLISLAALVGFGWRVLSVLHALRDERRRDRNQIIEMIALKSRQVEDAVGRIGEGLSAK